MKNLKLLSLLVFSFLFLTSCEKESEENTPEETTSALTTEPRIDLIRKVIRFNSSGGIEDSVLFKYDSQNRVVLTEFGSIYNGKYYGQIIYTYSKNQAGRGVILEKNLILNSSGQYDSLSFVSYTLNSDYKNASSIKVSSDASFQRRSSFQISYDSLNYIKEVAQIEIKKQMDYYLDYRFKVQIGNIVEALADSYPGAGGSCFYEYYPQAYNHELFISVLGMPHLYFWGTDLENVFDIRHRFLGKRNQNLVKKASSGNGNSETLDYEFNSLGLVSKINTTKNSASGVTPRQTKYEIFYY